MGAILLKVFSIKRLKSLKFLTGKLPNICEEISFRGLILDLVSLNFEMKIFLDHIFKLLIVYCLHHVLYIQNMKKVILSIRNHVELRIKISSVELILFPKYRRRKKVAKQTNGS